MASETVIDPRLYDAVILDFDDAVAAATAEAAATLISDLQRAGVGTAVTPRATGLSTSVTARVDGVTNKSRRFAAHLPGSMRGDRGCPVGDSRRPRRRIRVGDRRR